jgi:K+-transporting ATPase ATPase B chain
MIAHRQEDDQRASHRSSRSFWERQIVTQAFTDTLRKFHPRLLVRNPVIFTVAVVSCLTTVVTGWHLLSGVRAFFDLQVSLWLWFTVLFANFAEAIAEGRGKAQAEALRRMRSRTFARRVREGGEERIPAPDLRKGDIVICDAGDTIPADGVVIEGIASVDESAITGESAPVIRESGDERSAVTGGTVVLSDRIIVRVASDPGGGFLDRVISLVESARRQKTPNEIALTILLAGLSIIFLLAVASLPAFVGYSERASGPTPGTPLTFPILAALFVCLIPTTIGGLLSAIGISGMDRLIRKNVIATSGRAAEAAGDIDVLLLDKTGTITLGNRMATEFLPAPGVTTERLADAAQLASLADETPEGRSIVVLAKDRFGLRGRQVAEPEAHFIPFSAQSRMSGVDLRVENENRLRKVRKGSADAITTFVSEQGGELSSAVRKTVDEVARHGSTPLVVAENGQVLGVIRLKDMVKGSIRERFAQLRTMGIRTVMITGDNALTAAAIAAEAGVDDFIAEARPEDKLNRIRAEQAAGRLVGMIGDGTNDAPALAQADVGIAMNSGTQAAREAGNMVDLDSNPTKLIEVVEVGKKLLMTRGSLTTFSIANDVAKYFAIIPAIAGSLYASAGRPGPLAALNIMGLRSPESAVLSATIFNALIIILLIPLALRGVPYRAEGAAAVLRRNLLLYGLGGLVAPFVGIKIIDLLLVAMGVA